jgi:hypothetical protein
MSENIKEEDLVEEVDPTPESTEKVETEAKVETETEVETERDPLKIELEKIQKKEGRTELEKAQYSLRKNAERLRELGGEPETILGIPKEETEDDAPVTRSELKKIIESTATKTALQLADEISDPTERELTKYYLENRVVPSGNPQEDLRDARRIVNSVKNEQIVHEINRKTDAKKYSNSSGVPAKDNEVKGELTKEEILFTQKPFNLTKEQILKARTK